MDRDCNYCNSLLINSISKDEVGYEFLETVNRPANQLSSASDYAYFYHKKIKYIWRPEHANYVKLRGLDNEKCSVIYTHSNGFASQEAEVNYKLYGVNSIIVDVKPIWRLVFEEVSKFQFNHN